MHHPDTLANPCINICRMDLANRFCQGCSRTRLEIGSWPRMSDAERAQILAALPARRASSSHTT